MSDNPYMIRVVHPDMQAAQGEPRCNLRLFANLRPCPDERGCWCYPEATKP